MSSGLTQVTSLGPGSHSTECVKGATSISPVELYECRDWILWTAWLNSPGQWKDYCSNGDNVTAGHCTWLGLVKLK